jgi:hypothetical protein
MSSNDRQPLRGKSRALALDQLFSKRFIVGVLARIHAYAIARNAAYLLCGQFAFQTVPY